jgi:hypothetical protein
MVFLFFFDVMSVLSGGVHGNNPTSDEVGIVPLLSIYSKLESRSKKENSSHPVILESNDLVADPEGTLSSICASLSIPYTDSMLSWNSGAHECDGPWAKVSDAFIGKSCIKTHATQNSKNAVRKNTVVV